MTKALEAILKAEELSNLLEIFRAEDITDDILSDLTDKDLAKIGITQLGVRKRLIQAFQKPTVSTKQETHSLKQSSQLPVPIKPSNPPVVVPKQRNLGKTPSSRASVQPQTLNSKGNPDASKSPNENRDSSMLSPRSSPQKSIFRIIEPAKKSNPAPAYVPPPTSPASAFFQAFFTISSNLFTGILCILAWVVGIAVVGGFLCIVLYPVFDAIRSVQKTQTANHTSQMIPPKANSSGTTKQPPPKQNAAGAVKTLPEKSTPSEAKDLIAQRKRVFLNSYDPSDIKVTKTGDGRSNIVVSMFGRPVVTASTQLSSKQIPYYSNSLSR